MSKLSPTVRVHRDFARKLRTLCREASRDMGREVTSAEITASLLRLPALDSWATFRVAVTDLGPPAQLSDIRGVA